MTAVLDFDYTLFDTFRFKEAMLKALEDDGISRAEFDRCYEEIVGADISGAYDPKTHVACLRGKSEIEDDEALRTLDAVAKRSAEFVYPGAKDFIMDIRKRVGRTVLVTYGQSAWQQQKVLHSGLGGLFDEKIFTDQDKAEALCLLEKGSGGLVVINDNPDETKRMAGACPHGSYHLINLNGRAIPEGLPFPVHTSYADALNSIFTDRAK